MIDEMVESQLIKSIVDQLVNEVSAQPDTIELEGVNLPSSSQLSSCGPVPPSFTSGLDTDIFELRNISFMNSSRRIVMQNGDGPCPLIALVNTLILKGSILPATLVKNGKITRANVTNFVANELVERRRSREMINDDNESKRIDDVLHILPDLVSGLMVNVEFHDVTAFEYTTAVDLYDLLGCRLFHAWLAEKDSSDYFIEDIGTKSYNVVATEAFENENLRNFLFITKGQMTYSGLFALREVLREGEVGVFFRNNHFHTILKKQGDICLLCTDLGYKDARSYVWEVLMDIEGNSTYLNENFREERPSETEVSQPSAQNSPSGDDTSNDHELAKELQKQLIQERPSSQQNSPQRNQQRNNLPNMDRVIPPRTQAGKADKPMFRELLTLMNAARSAAQSGNFVAAKHDYEKVIGRSRSAVQEEGDDERRDGLIKVLRLLEDELQQVVQASSEIEELSDLFIEEFHRRDHQVWSPPPLVTTKLHQKSLKSDKPRLPPYVSQSTKTGQPRTKAHVEVAKDMSKYINDISTSEQGSDGKQKFEPELVSMIKSTMTKGGDVKFSDIAGLEDVKAIIRKNIVCPMIHPALFTGIRSPCRGFLFYGLPGTGKSKLANAIATETASTFFYISCSAISSKWRGESEKLIKILFDLAGEHAPSTIFIDEIDTIGSERGVANEHEASRRVKSELLLNMDLLNTSGKQIWVIGATNLPWCIDSALRRRFEKRIYVPLPDLCGRSDLLKMSLSTVKLSNDVDLQLIAQRLEGYSNADIISVCKEAATLGISNLMNSMSFEEFKDLCVDNVDIPVTSHDFDVALGTISSSINQNDIEQFEKWSSDYGSM